MYHAGLITQLWTAALMRNSYEWIALSSVHCATTAENGVMTKGLCSGGGWPPLRCITSSPSQTLRRRLVRTTDDGRRGECSTLAVVRRGFVFDTSRLVRLISDHTLDLYAAKPDTRPESRFWLIPHLHSTPPFGGWFPSDCLHPVWHGKLEWLGYPTVEKFRRYLYSFSSNSRTWQTHTRTHGSTDTAWRHRPRLCIASRGKNFRDN